MLNQEKIRLMCSIESFEKHRGEEELKVLEFYKFDYIMRNSAFSFLRYTICFILCAVLYVLFNTKDLFYSINLSGITEITGKLVIIYLLGLIVYLIITVLVYSMRYDKACREIDGYARDLKKLDRRFNKKGGI